MPKTIENGLAKIVENGLAELGRRRYDAGDAPGDPRYAFALPGNPVSALVTATLLVVPALKRLGGYSSELCPPPEAPLELADAVALDAVRPEYRSRADIFRGHGVAATRLHGNSMSPRLASTESPRRRDSP